MRRFLKAIVFVPLAIVVILFSVANRGPVAVSLDPFGAADSALTMEAPLFLLLFAAAVLGAIAGGVGAWMNQSAHRRAARLAERELAAKRDEVERLRRIAEPAQTLPSPIR
jgi:uncharacterized integral membrane protein